MCDIVCEKMKGGGGTEQVFTQKQPSEGFFQKGVMRNFAKFTRKHLCRKNETPQKLFSKFIRTLILQNGTGRLFLIIAVSIYETVNYDTKIKA